MIDLEAMRAEPWRFDFLAALRAIERSHPDKPRIGNSATVADDYVRLGQDPFIDFPASNLSKVELGPDESLRIFVKFLGLLGPQGALPLATTEEALGWHLMQDDAFPRFLDLLNHRFLQLFFRAWANSRPIAQSDRPHDDRFRTYIGAMIGLGTDALRRRDTVPDDGKLSFAGLSASQCKSASRLKGMISGLFGVTVEIDEFVGSRLPMERPDQTSVGDRNSRLGDDIIVGGSSFSVADKFRIRLFVKDMAQYARFLPSGDRCEPLVDLVFSYVGDGLEWELELALPTPAVEAISLGGFGQVGWTTWISPNWDAEDAYRCDARFNPANQVRLNRQKTV